MANVLYSVMLPEVSPHCSGAPEPQMINAIRNACIEFCMRSWCWNVDTSNMGISPTVQDYPIDPSVLPSSSAVADIMYGYFNGVTIPPITKADAEIDFPAWRTRSGPTPKRFLAGDAATKVSLIPIPNVSASGLIFSLALKPSRRSTGFPDFLYERYLEDISHGAIYRMMSIPHKSWSNANLALTHKNLFENAAAQARVDNSKSYTRAVLRSRPSGVANW